MPNPKRRHSKRRTSTRRANDFLTKPALGKCPNCHEMKQPHQVCPTAAITKGKPRKNRRSSSLPVVCGRKSNDHDCC